MWKAGFRKSMVNIWIRTLLDIFLSMGCPEIRAWSRSLYVNMLLEIAMMEKQVWGKEGGNKVGRNKNNVRCITDHLPDQVQPTVQSHRTSDKSHQTEHHRSEIQKEERKDIYPPVTSFLSFSFVFIDIRSCWLTSVTVGEFWSEKQGISLRAGEKLSDLYHA